MFNNGTPRKKEPTHLVFYRIILKKMKMRGVCTVSLPGRWTRGGGGKKGAEKGQQQNPWETEAGLATDVQT